MKPVTIDDFRRIAAAYEAAKPGDLVQQDVLAHLAARTLVEFVKQTTERNSDAALLAALDARRTQCPECGGIGHAAANCENGG